MVNKPLIRPYFPPDFSSGSSRGTENSLDATKRHTFQCLSQVSDTSAMEEIFVDLRIHGTSKHWKFQSLVNIPLLHDQWTCWFRSRLKCGQANQSQSHIALYCLTPFSSSFTHLLNQVLHETRIISSINTPRGPDLLQSKSPLSFWHLKLGVKTFSHWMETTSKDRTVTKVPCLIRFNHFFQAKMLKSWVKGSLKRTSGRWLNDPEILVSFNPWHHTKGLWFKACQHIEEAEGASGAYRVACSNF